MKKDSLFRKEVLKSKESHPWGTVFINLPCTYQYIICGFLLLSLGIVFFCCWAEFSEQYVVKGYINSSKGVVRAFPSKAGVIIKSFVHLGSSVKKGDILFLVDTSNEGFYQKESLRILDELLKRKALLDKDIVNKKEQLQTLHRLFKKHFISKNDINHLDDALRDLENNKSLIDMELIRYQQERSYHVRAPLDGTISTLMYKPGQNITVNKPLIKILPKNARLQAELLVPVQQAGFLNTNALVHLRYDTYPYTHFGTYKARLREITQSILTDEEDEKPIRMGVPYFKASARLDSPWVNIYGGRKKIQAGMTFSAVILGTKRKIWQWIFDPLLSYRGALLA